MSKIFNFRDLPLSQVARSQLAGVAETFAPLAPPTSKRKLFDWIRDHAYDERRGLYVPVSSRTDLPGKLPQSFESAAAEYAAGSSLTYFANPLIVPTGFGLPSFNRYDHTPKLRQTNAGWIVTTLEYDPESTDEFEEVLSWTRVRDDGRRPVDIVDQALSAYSEYRGYCVVFSGGKSLHFHFIWDISHLEYFPSNIDATARLNNIKAESAALATVHNNLWDEVERALELIGSGLKPDTKMRSAVQWRRAPWMLRTLEATSLIGIPAGERVLQSVIVEKVRKRAANGAQQFMVPEGFRPVTTLGRPARRRPGARAAETSSEVAVAALREECRRAWGADFPQASHFRREGGDWAIYFKNHAGDQTPSTVARGDHKGLLVSGNAAFSRDFFLPDDLTANETCEFILRVTGVPRRVADARWDELRNVSPQVPPSLRRFLSVPFPDQQRAHIQEDFSLPYSDTALGDIVQQYRTRMSVACRASREYSHRTLVVGGEGLGKSTSHLPLVMEEVREHMLATGAFSGVFGAFAFRSVAQAEDKAREIAAACNAPPVKVIRSFWTYYSKACEEESVAPIDAMTFEDGRMTHILGEIQARQPAVYARLEAMRRSLWRDVPFTGGTLLLMSHRMAEQWLNNHTTVPWHHPGFDPENEAANDLKVSVCNVVFDDPEPDAFVHRLTEDQYEFIKRHQGGQHNYRNLPRRVRVDIFDALPSDAGRPPDFYTFDELMRLDLKKLKAVSVDFDRIPFGTGETDANVYRHKHGTAFYIGPKEWTLSVPFSRITFLTTETLVAMVIRRTFSVFYVDLRDAPGLSHIPIPIRIEPRAAADRDGEDRVSALAHAIVAANENAVVIANGCRPHERIMTFQRAKGRNGLEGRDVHIILGHLNPGLYAELNALGQWLDYDEVLRTYYQDQLDQAVGRNRGARDAGVGAQTVVHATSRLWKKVLSLDSDFGRAALYPEAPPLNQAS